MIEAARSPVNAASKPPRLRTKAPPSRVASSAPHPVQRTSSGDGLVVLTHPPCTRTSRRWSPRGHFSGHSFGRPPARAVARRSLPGRRLEKNVAATLRARRRKRRPCSDVAVIARRPLGDTASGPPDQATDFRGRTWIGPSRLRRKPSLGNTSMMRSITSGSSWPASARRSGRMSL